jgi:hypothetical protein
MYAARVWIDRWASTSCSKSANDATAKNILHIGLAYRGGEVMRGTATAGVFEDADNETAASCEIAWRWSRLFAMGEYFVQKDEQVNPAAAPTWRLRVARAARRDGANRSITSWRCATRGSSRTRMSPTPSRPRHGSSTAITSRATI